MILRTSYLRRLGRKSFSTYTTRSAQFNTEGRADGFAKRSQQSSGGARASSDDERPSESSSTSEPYDKVASALQQSSGTDANHLLAPVHIPNDSQGVLPLDHPSTSILANSSIVVQRQLEMMNVLLGFEQVNKYVIMDGQGNHIGYLAEQDHGLGSSIARQAFKTHRSFTTHVFDRHENEILRFHRPFSWISSRIRVYDAHTPSDIYAPSDALAGTSPGSVANSNAAQISQRALADMRVVGEAQQQWAPLRRKYNLFLHRDLSKETANDITPKLTSGELPLSKSTDVQAAEDGKAELGFRQFAYVDEPLLSWDFSLKSEDQQLIGSVNRNFAGFAREIFTDTGVYALRMDSAGLAQDPRQLITNDAGQEVAAGHITHMTLDQRAVMLATAVTIDFDYFSRHSHSGVGGGFMPMWFPWGGGASGEAAGAGGAAGAGEAGAAGTAVGEAGQASRGIGAGEGIAGAGTMAGYEAMQRGRESMSQSGQDDQSPQASDWPPSPQDDPHGNGASEQRAGEEVWGTSESRDQPQEPFDQGQSGESGEGGGWSLFDFFDGDE